MVALFLVDVVGTGCNVSGNNNYCCLIYIVEIFHMAFLGQVFGIHIVYYVSFFAAFHVIIHFRGRERTVVTTSLMH
jgi:hypothetical protein